MIQASHDSLNLSRKVLQPLRNPEDQNRRSEEGVSNSKLKNIVKCNNDDQKSRAKDDQVNQGYSK